MDAARRALETGDARHIIRVPGESGHTLRNLPERACCERTVEERTGGTGEWYFRTVCRLHALHAGPGSVDLPARTPEEKRILLRILNACDCGSYQEPAAVARDSPELRERFRLVLDRRAYPAGDTGSGRRYVSTLTGLAAAVMPGTNR